ncbi:MAG: hypothetical protein IPJ98_31360 [Bryobacterales bacterium]|nr:hypothetical protein [Bryobacterales bacterium]
MNLWQMTLHGARSATTLFFAPLGFGSKLLSEPPPYKKKHRYEWRTEAELVVLSLVFGILITIQTSQGSNLNQHLHLALVIITAMFAVLVLFTAMFLGVTHN